MIMSQATDWKKFDSHAQELERKFISLLKSGRYSQDDRRLTRAYVALARLIADRLDSDLLYIIELVDKYCTTGEFSSELNGQSVRLGKMAADARMVDFISGKQMDAQYIYSLFEACTMRKFSVDPESGAMPIEWMAAMGVAINDVEKALSNAYPEIGNSL